MVTGSCFSLSFGCFSVMPPIYNRCALSHILFNKLLKKKNAMPIEWKIDQDHDFIGNTQARGYGSCKLSYLLFIFLGERD